MIKRICFIVACVAMTLGSIAQVTSFDSGWKFFRGGAQRAEMPDYDDSKWRSVDLPHDWSIEDLPGTNSPFDPAAIGQVSTGFTVGGSGWYRKTFVIPAGQKGKRIHIQFDGVYMNAEYWLNGEQIGKHPYGYTSCWFDVTDKVRAGESNVLSVQVKNEGQNSRWYSGSGIYRHVWLRVLDPVHVAPWGTYITTPEVSESTAKVVIKSELENKSAAAADIRVVTRIFKDKSEIGKAEARLKVNAGSSGEIESVIQVERPLLWSLESPDLYTAVTEVYQGDRLADRKEEKFGIRSISFDAANGFRLNGKPVKLKGGCVHHDNGPLGAKAYDRAEERRVELLKAAGFNAIRSSHNPPSPAFLDACDRLGMLVIDEAFDMWRIPNNPHDYHLFFDEWWQHDIESMVKRDRNHPSIIMWSIGNEIREMESQPVMAVAKMLGDHIRKMEPTRPVTAAVNNLRPQKDPFFANLDVSGYNYAAGGDHLQESLYVQDHKRISNRVMFGSESYPLEAFGAWQGVEENPFVIGDFVWTAFDYIGEASIGWRGYWQESSFYPWNLAYCGDIDICGWRRPQSYFREALWRENTLGLFVKPPVPTFPLNPNKQSWSKWEWHDVQPDWNWKGYEGQPLEVNAYSSCDQVELILNGKSLGKKPAGKANRYEAKWQVPYNSGELKAVGYKGKKAVATSILKTAADLVALRLTADRNVINADGQDLSYITVELVDDKGNKDPKAENALKFEVEGEGTIVAVGNAHPMSTESYQLPNRKAWQGRCLVIVKSNQKAGSIKLKAVSDGLKTGEITIQSK